jgi:hypothetical protein
MIQMMNAAQDKYETLQKASPKPARGQAWGTR